MKRLFSVLTIISILLSSFSICTFAKDEFNFDALEFPAEAISDFDESILTHASSSDTSEANKGYEESGTYISPYWKCKIQDFSVPVYSALSYDYINDLGVLHSYAHIWFDLNEEITLSFNKEDIKKVSVFPSDSGAEYKTNGNNIQLKIKEYGTYTILINDDLTQYGFTLFAEEYTDEAETVNNYINTYGKENVLVFDKDYYETDKLKLNDYKVIYFCRGSYFKVIHSESSEHKTFIELSGKENIIIDGCGTFDFNSCNHKETDPCFINSCKNSEISGLNFINPDHWTFYTYACENLKIKNISSIGYRTNSDGINICNSKDVTVSNSFIRTGDDSFSVKTMSNAYPCENVTFENCTAWSTKARCFGITGEVEADIRNITFKNSVVIDRPAVWDNNRLGSLCIIVENGKGQIDGITFENIEINHDNGRGINCTIYGSDVTDCQIKNVVFKNITCNEEMKSQISSSCNLSSKQKFCSFVLKIFKFFNIDNKITHKLKEVMGNNSVCVSFQNVKLNNKTIKKINLFTNISEEGNVDITF